jgi:hypothetical protein
MEPLKLKRRPLRSLVRKDDDNIIKGGPQYLNPATNSGGTMRDVPSLGPYHQLGGRLGGY